MPPFTPSLPTSVASPQLQSGVLTPQLLSAFDKISGATTDPNSLPPDPVTQTRAQEILAMGNSTPSPDTSSPDTSFIGRVSSDISSRMGQAKSAINSGDWRGGTALPGKDTSIQTINKLGQAGLGAANDVFGEIGKSVASLPGVSTVVNGISQDPRVQMASQGIEGWKELLGPVWDSLVQNHPDIASTLTTLGSSAQLAGNIVGANAMIETAPSILKTGVGAAKDVLAGAKSTISDAMGNVAGKIALKTPEEVLATPRELAGKLTPTQYSAWEKNQNKLLLDSQKAEQTALDTKQAGEQNTTLQQKQSEQDLLSQEHSRQQASLRQEHQANLENIAKTSQDKTDQLLTERDALKKSFIDNSRATAIDARQPIKNWIQDAGQHYRDLVEENLAPKAKVIVNNTDVAAEVDKTFGKDPIMAGKVKNALGLTEQVNPLSEKPASLKPTTTIGKLYEQAKGLKQGIGTAAKSGARVFTPDEMVTQNAVRIVSKILENNGVDLSAANKFWSEYAPARNLAVSKFQPFDVGEFKANAGATTLQKAAQGTNTDLANLVKKIEDSTGKPLTADLKSTLEKMTTNQRQSVVEKINAEEAVVASEKAKQQSFENLKTRQTFEKNALSQKQASEQSILDQQHANEQQQLEGKKSGEKQQLKNSNLTTKTQIERKAMIKNIIKGIATGGAAWGGYDIIKHL